MNREPAQEIEDAFSSRVKHNFRTQLLLCLKGKNWTREDILSTIYNLTGYKCHKVVRYGYKWSHIHIKFEGESFAQTAKTKLENLNPDLFAVVVEDLLKEWYKFEMMIDHTSTLTMTVVNTVGSTPHCLNFLTENILNYLFEDFGNPYLLPYTAAVSEQHVQMAFYSMSEALAACMAFGEWYKGNEKLDRFCYRVRINPAQREAFLIRICGGDPEEAFKLGYFVQMRSEVIKGRETNGCEKCSSGLSQSNEWNNSNEMLRNPNVKERRISSRFSRHHRSSQNVKNEIAPYRMRRHKHKQSIGFPSNVSNLCTPLVCVPLISPLNVSCAQVLAPPKNTSTDFENALMKFPKSYAEVVESNSKGARGRLMLTEACTSARSFEVTTESSEDANSTGNKPGISSEKDASHLNRASDCDSISHSKDLENLTKAKKPECKSLNEVVCRK